MLKGIVVFQKGLVGPQVLFPYKLPVGGQPFIQAGLFCFDLLDQADHGGVVRGHDVGQGQAVNIHHGAPDLLQLPLADHVLVYNGARVGMDVVDAEYRKDIGEQRHQSQQNNGQDQALLQCQFGFHRFSS